MGKIMSFRLSIKTLFCLTVFLVPALCTGQVIKHPDSGQRLSSRLEWAFGEVSRGNLTGEYWIGYSVSCLMGEYSWIYSTKKNTFHGNLNFGRNFKGQPLRDILSGKKPASSPAAGPKEVRQAAREALDRMENSPTGEKKVKKDVAVLFLFDSKDHKGRQSRNGPSEIVILNTDLPFEGRHHAVIWMGPAEENESISLLEEIFKKEKTDHLKKRLLTAVGLHSGSERAVSFLLSVFNGREAEDIRRTAAFELGDTSHPAALQPLWTAALKDKSIRIRKAATYALEDMKLPGAVDALIDIARHSDSREIRKAAVSTLGDIASRQAADELEKIVYSDDDTEVQKRAVSAIEDLPEEMGLPMLIKIAKTHPQPSIRKRAIACLGDSENPRALDTLIEILKK